MAVEPNRLGCDEVAKLIGVAGCPNEFGPPRISQKTTNQKVTIRSRKFPRTRLNFFNYQYFIESGVVDRLGIITSSKEHTIGRKHALNTHQIENESQSLMLD